MKKFTPIAMRCTQEQFDAIKPKLASCRLTEIRNFIDYPYLTNCYVGLNNEISNIEDDNLLSEYNGTVHEEWDEEIFLKACCIEVEPTLTEQLEKAEVEVKRLKEAIEDSKIKVGDWCTFWNHDKSKSIIAKFQGSKFACITSGDYFLNCEKITNKELINKLNEL